MMNGVWLRLLSALPKACRGLFLGFLLVALVGPGLAMESAPPSLVVGISRPVPQGFALHPGKGLLATLKKDGAEVADLASLAVKLHLGRGESPPVAVVFSANGAFTALGHEKGQVTVWDQEGRRLARLKEHGDRVMALAFSPDGQFLAGGGYDGTVHVWAAGSWKLVASLEGFADVLAFEHAMYRAQAVLALQFSPDGRFLYALETLFANESRNVARTRVLSAWAVGSWSETGRLVRNLKGMEVNGRANPLDAPLAIAPGDEARIFVAADDGEGDPRKVVPPTAAQVRTLRVGECFPDIGDPSNLPPSDTWPTALSSHGTKGWLAAAYLEGPYPDFTPGIALIPRGDGAGQRNWPTHQQSLQLAFDNDDRLYSLSSDGLVLAWNLGPLKTLAPVGGKTGGDGNKACRPANEAPSAQARSSGRPGALSRLASWKLGPELLKKFFYSTHYRERFTLTGDRLILWWDDTIILNAGTGALIDRYSPSGEKEYFIPSPRLSPRLIGRPGALVAVDPGAGKERILDEKPGWKLVSAAVNGPYLATAWSDQANDDDRKMEFHILPLAGGKPRVVQPAPFPNAGKSANTRAAPYFWRTRSFMVSADGRWLGYESYKKHSYDRWILLDTQTGKSWPLTVPLQSFGGSRLLVHDARWMGLAVVDIGTGQVEARLGRHQNRLPPDSASWASFPALLSGALSWDGKRVVSGARDGSIKVWDVATRAEIAADRGSPSPVMALGFNHDDGQRFFTMQVDGTVTLWQIQDGR